MGEKKCLIQSCGSFFLQLKFVAFEAIRCVLGIRFGYRESCVKHFLGEEQKSEVGDANGGQGWRGGGRWSEEAGAAAAAEAAADWDGIAASRRRRRRRSQQDLYGAACKTNHPLSGSKFMVFFKKNLNYYDFFF